MIPHVKVGAPKPAPEEDFEHVRTLVLREEYKKARTYLRSIDPKARAQAFIHLLRLTAN